MPGHQFHLRPPMTSIFLWKDSGLAGDYQPMPHATQQHLNSIPLYQNIPKQTGLLQQAA